MQPIVRSLLVEALEPAVLDFETEVPGLRLRNDLNRLDDVRSIHACEAEVFYSVRIVEVMARTVLLRVTGALFLLAGCRTLG